MLTNGLNADLVNKFQTVGSHNKGVHRGGSAPKLQRIGRVGKVVNIEFEWVLMGKPTNRFWLTALHYAGSNPHKCRAGAAANPFDTGSNHKVCRPLAQINRQNTRGLSDVDQRQNTFIAAELRNFRDRQLAAIV